MEVHRPPNKNVFNSCNDLVAETYRGRPPGRRNHQLSRLLFCGTLYLIETQEPPATRKNVAAAFHAQVAQDGRGIRVSRLPLSLTLFCSGWRFRIR